MKGQRTNSACTIVPIVQKQQEAEASDSINNSVSNKGVSNKVTPPKTGDNCVSWIIVRIVSKIINI